jgi:hypothetical protein
VASLPVVEDLQVLKDRVGELDAGAPASLVESRLFEARPSANAEGIRSAAADYEQLRAAVIAELPDL